MDFRSIRHKSLYKTVEERLSEIGILKTDSQIATKYKNLKKLYYEIMKLNNTSELKDCILAVRPKSMESQYGCECDQWHIKQRETRRGSLARGCDASIVMMKLKISRFRKVQIVVKMKRTNHHKHLGNILNSWTIKLNSLNSQRNLNVNIRLTLAIFGNHIFFLKTSSKSILLKKISIVFEENWVTIPALALKKFNIFLKQIYTNSLNKVDFDSLIDSLKQ